MSARRRKDKRLWYVILGLFVATFLFSFLLQLFKKDNKRVEAASLTDFDPGYIISDYQMSNYNSMSEVEIQAFLNQKGNCRDTRIYLANQYPGYSYHVRDGHFVCLAEETFGDGTNYGDNAPNGESAAHIIYWAAQDYRINPQVLIVLLQKEQGLITDSWPNDHQFRSATGYGCPDTAPCNVEYYGFKNQVRKAAALFRAVLDGGWTNYPLGNNYIQYNPNAACGGSMVNIRSLATSALYRYTPYQPNAEALLAGYGTAYCGAYGNRNFYLYFEDWFGGIKNEKISDGRKIVDGVYYIEQKGDVNKVLNVSGAQSVLGVNVELWNKEEKLHQTWRIMRNDDGYYSIQDVYSGLFVDLYAALTNDGTNIHLWSRNDTCAQKWNIQEGGDGYYSFISGCDARKAIDLRAGIIDDGTNIQIWESNGTDAQKWVLRPAASIAEGRYVLATKLNTKKVLDVNSALKENGTNIHLWSEHREAAQIWYIDYNSDTDDYTLINPNSGKALDVRGGSMNDGTNIQLWEKNDTCAQRWKIVQTADNYYTLLSSCSNDMVLDLSGADTTNGANIHIWHNNLTDAQKWSLIPAIVIADGIYSVVLKSDSSRNLKVFGEVGQDGANVQFGSGEQKWKISYNYDNGYYSVTNFGKALDVCAAYTQSGTNVHLWAQNWTCAQRWRILKDDDGYYTFMSGCAQSYVLDVDDDILDADEANVRLWRSKGGDTQKWVLH